MLFYFGTCFTNTARKIFFSKIVRFSKNWKFEYSVNFIETLYNHRNIYCNNCKYLVSHCNLYIYLYIHINTIRMSVCADVKQFFIKLKIYILHGAYNINIFSNILYVR